MGHSVACALDPDGDERVVSVFGLAQAANSGTPRHPMALAPVAYTL